VLAHAGHYQNEGANTDVANTGDALKNADDDNAA